MTDVIQFPDKDARLWAGIERASRKILIASGHGQQACDEILHNLKARVLGVIQNRHQLEFDEDWSQADCLLLSATLEMLELAIALYWAKAS